MDEVKVEASKKIDEKVEFEDKEEPEDTVEDLPEHKVVNQSEIKIESDWVTSSSQVAEVINTSDYKSEVVYNNAVTFHEPSAHEPSSS